MRSSGLLIALAAAVLLAGCNHDLTQSTAPGILQTLIDRQQEPVTLDLAPLRAMMDRTHSDRVQDMGMVRLIHAGYISEKQVRLNYENLSNHYQGLHFGSTVVGRMSHSDTYDLDTDTRFNPPQVHGVMKSCLYTSCATYSFSGTEAQAGHASQLQGHIEGYGPNVKQLTLSLEPVAGGLRGQFTDPTIDGTEVNPVSAVRVGNAVPGEISELAYEYTFTNRLPQNALSVDGQFLTLVQGDGAMGQPERVYFSTRRRCGVTLSSQRGERLA